MTVTPSQLRNHKLAEKVVSALKLHHFEAYSCTTKEEAKQKALELIPKNDLIAWGGSMTLQQINLLDYLKNNNYHILDRDKAQTPEEKDNISRQSLLSDTYLTSTNAISEDGQLINIDGKGNRVAAITFGPKNVIVIAGINKITKTLEDALSRARHYAAPTNAQRFSTLKIPCLKTGSCENCLSPDSICAYFSTTRISRPAGRIKVILVEEDLGY